jgi:hypothetical protein
MVNQACPIARGRGISKNYADSLGAGINHSLNVRAAKGRAVFFFLQAGEYQIGYLLN